MFYTTNSSPLLVTKSVFTLTTILIIIDSVQSPSCSLKLGPAEPKFIELLKQQIVLQFSAKQKYAGYQSQMVIVEWYFGWLPYSGVHDFVLHCYCLCLNEKAAL